MANKPISMLRIRQLIQFLERGVSLRKISTELRMGRNIVSAYTVDKTVELVPPISIQVVPGISVELVSL